MNIDIYSIIMSVLWSDILILIFLFFSKNTRIISTLNYISVFLLSLLCILRILVPIEFPFTKIVRSYSVYPAFRDLLNQNIITGDTINIKISLGSLLLIIWVAGSLICFLALLISNHRSHKKLILHRHPDAHLSELLSKHPKSDNVDIFLFDKVSSPFMAGIFHPSIYIPDIGLSDEEINVVLAHELSHYRNRDTLTKLSVYFMCCIFWWNLPLHFLRININFLLEVKSDMVAIRESGNSQPVYFEFILSIAKKCQLITHKSAPTELSLFSSVRQSDLLKRFRVTEKVIIPSVKSFLYSLTVSLVFCITFLASYLVQLQPAGFPAEQQDGIPIFDIDSSTSYLLKTGNKYQLYIDGAFVCEFGPEILDIDDFKSLPIKEINP